MIDVIVVWSFSNIILFVFFIIFDNVVEHNKNLVLDKSNFLTYLLFNNSLHNIVKSLSYIILFDKFILVNVESFLLTRWI